MHKENFVFTIFVIPDLNGDAIQTHHLAKRRFAAPADLSFVVGQTKRVCLFHLFALQLHQLRANELQTECFVVVAFWEFGFAQQTVCKTLCQSRNTDGKQRQRDDDFNQRKTALFFIRTRKTPLLPLNNLPPRRFAGTRERIQFVLFPPVPEIHIQKRACKKSVRIDRNRAVAFPGGIGTKRSVFG